MALEVASIAVLLLVDEPIFIFTVFASRDVELNWGEWQREWTSESASVSGECV